MATRTPTSQEEARLLKALQAGVVDVDLMMIGCGLIKLKVWTKADGEPMCLRDLGLEGTHKAGLIGKVISGAGRQTLIDDPSLDGDSVRLAVVGVHLEDGYKTVFLANGGVGLILMQGGRILRLEISDANRGVYCGTADVLLVADQ